MKNKTLIAVVAFVIAFSCASCGKKDDDSSSSKKPAAESAADTTVTSDEETEETTAEETTETTDQETAETAENPLGSTADINNFIDTKEIDPPLWKVTDPESGNSMYLLGTIHVLPAEISDYPADLMDIYNSCDSIAVEYDVTALQTDMNAQLEYVKGMMYSDGTNVKDHISEETYNKLREYFTKIGAYSEMMDQYSAGYWISLLDNVMLMRLENVELSGTDVYFINKAQQDGKEVINIEDLSMQTEALTAYTDEYADYSIAKMIDEIDDIDGFAEDYADLFEKWANGDGEIKSETEEDLAELPEDLIDDNEAYDKKLIDDRNKYMADKASEYIKEGKNCLFMVGAAHYAGEEGVDDLLEKMGYTVEKIG
jgi:hypothetical protein